MCFISFVVFLRNNCENKLHIRIIIYFFLKKQRAHLPTILSLYSSFGFTHVEWGVIHPTDTGKVSDYSPGHHDSLLGILWQSLPKAILTPRNPRAPWTVCPVNAVFVHPSLLCWFFASSELLLGMFVIPTTHAWTAEADNAQCVSSSGAARQTDVYSSLSCHFAKPSALWLERTRAGWEQLPTHV